MISVCAATAEGFGTLRARSLCGFDAARVSERAHYDGIIIRVILSRFHVFHRSHQ